VEYTIFSSATGWETPSVRLNHVIDMRRGSAGANGKAGSLSALRTMSSDSDDSAVIVARPSASPADGAAVTLTCEQILADKCVSMDACSEETSSGSIMQRDMTVAAATAHADGMTPHAQQQADWSQS
jgi:hypothetical protein